MFFLWLRQLPRCGDWTPASVLPPSEGRSSPNNLPASPSSSVIWLIFAWFYTFFSSGQVLLSALSWSSACTSESEVVFLMYCTVHLLLHYLVLSPPVISLSIYHLICDVIAFGLKCTLIPHKPRAPSLLFFFWNYVYSTILIFLN